MADTIAAISTASAPAGIGVIRISGNDACKVADSVFKAISGVKTADMKGYNAALGQIFDSEGKVDEAVAIRFVAPKSYTGEDIVELSCHGGEYLLRRALRAVISAGARMAQPGEFTRRAFLNGKLDLTAAESVMDLISAQGSGAHLAAISARSGATFSACDKVKELLISASADLAAWCDFPDEDVPYVEPTSLKSTLVDAKDELCRLISTADSGRLLMSGVNTVIAGKPNVGKSSVMNLLARCDRSIVTDIAGTTRDIIEESVCVGGITLRLADTAGLRDTLDPVEAVGVELARKRIEGAQLIIAVFDSSREFDSEDLALISLLKGRCFVALLNKSDLPQKADLSLAEGIDFITICAKNDSPEAVEKAVAKVLGTDKIDPSAGLIANERQLDCARRALNAIEEGINGLDFGITLDAVGVCIEDAVTALCEMTGERASESVVDEVFSRFCVGK